MKCKDCQPYKQNCGFCPVGGDTSNRDCDIYCSEAGDKKEEYRDNQNRINLPEEK
jgi:hypothetical protein